VSNRAPHEPRPEGGFARGAGGVITALLTLAEVTAADWVACARTESERQLVAEQGTTWTAPLIRSETRLHYATPTPDQYEQYYSVIANPVLWFIQHYLWDLAQQPIINGRIHKAWAQGYVPVNEQVARRVVEVGSRLPDRPLVLVHDYQLSHGRLRSTGRSCRGRCATPSCTACSGATSSASSRAWTFATSS
jgi:trehalose 6-phosphate synthase